MKKIFIISVCLLAAFASNAQLENTSWTANFRVPDDTPMILQFKNDTLFLRVAETGEDFEVMKYSIKSDTLTYTKISGNSDCGPADKAVYKIEIKNETLFLNLVSDECPGRADATPAEGFKKVL